MTRSTNHGGKRAGAGRPKGSGRYGEATLLQRIPKSLHAQIMHVLAQPQLLSPPELTLYSGKVSAGFPSPVDDNVQAKINLNDHLIKTPQATFLVRATGDSMIHAGIYDNDILVVDRSLEPRHGKIVIAVLNGELTVKRLHIKHQQTQLIAENPKYPPLVIRCEDDFMIWGVVTFVIHAT